MITPKKCRVDSCDRNAAASMVRDNLPGPLPLCATHTEEFRQTGDGWTIVWDGALLDPSSVIPQVAARIGRPDSVGVEQSTPPGRSVATVKSRVAVRWRKRSE